MIVTTNLLTLLVAVLLSSGAQILLKLSANEKKMNL